MSASLFASKLVKQPVEEQPRWTQGQSGNARVLIGGNVLVLVLIASMVYGIYHMDWWIPVACLFVSFPVLHVVVLERIFAPAKGFLFSGAIALGSAPLIWFFW
ncbi:hypothetical protein [Motiliproteus sp. MSK22-1]|uniref:hypothetical protein n=1 Tax=Motiliproteus sp. MSK22-1 TaxID=1897630 RepID=UPI000976BB31|nr:hypothetical protein [Motiliproteus sp. MSK22-1]OMH38179.1 hypothetical protein BGP75_07935 [Motiliproteus sp. MSK22-1]